MIQSINTSFWFIQSKLKDNPSVQYIFEQYRKHQVTDERTCRAKDELLFQAQLYSTYLESIGQYKRLMDIYGKGEVSLEEAARKVGLKLPEKH